MKRFEILLCRSATIFACGGGIALAGGLSGCGDRSDASSGAALAVVAAVPQVTQTAAEDLVVRFAANLVRGNIAGDQAMMSPQFLARGRPAIGQWLHQGPYQPLGLARRWQFSGAQYLKHGRSLLVRSVFFTGDGSRYFTNFTFVNVGGNWLIDDVLPPEKPRGGVQGNMAHISQVGA